MRRRGGLGLGSRGRGSGFVGGSRPIRPSVSTHTSAHMGVATWAARVRWSRWLRVSLPGSVLRVGVGASTLKLLNLSVRS